MLVDKNKNYNGPRTAWAIYKQIRRELIDRRNIFLQPYEIESVVMMFFKKNGFPFYFNKMNTFDISIMGTFKLTHEGMLKRLSIKRYKRAKKQARNLEYYRKYFNVKTPRKIYGGKIKRHANKDEKRLMHNRNMNKYRRRLSREKKEREEMERKKFSKDE